MPRLPTDQQLGDAAVPGPARGVYGVNAGAPQAAAERAGAMQARSALELGNVADKLAQAQLRINAQQETVERVRVLGEYEKASMAELTRLQTEDDLSKPDTTNKYGAFLADSMKKALENYSGSPEGKAQLAQRLEATRFTLVGQAATVGTQLGRVKVKQAFGNRLSKITNEVSANPAKMADALQALDRELADLADALGPEQEIEFLSVGQKEIAMSAVNSLVARGNAKGARDIINTTPGFREMLGSEGQRSLDARLMSIEARDDEARSAGHRKVEEAKQILGVGELTTAQRIRLAGLAEPQGEKTPAQKIASLEAALGPLSDEQKAKALGVYIEQKGVDQSSVAAMRKEFTAQAATFVKTRDAYGRIKAITFDDTGAGDVALIFSYMKILDPDTGVKEGEIALAQQTANIPDRVRIMYNNAIQGHKLTATQRDDFKKQATNLYKSQLDTQKMLETTYRGLAKRAGYNPEDVVTNLIGDGEATATTGTGEAPVIQYGLGGQRVGAVKK